MIKPFESWNSTIFIHFPCYILSQRLWDSQIKKKKGWIITVSCTWPVIALNSQEILKAYIFFHTASAMQCHTLWILCCTITPEAVGCKNASVEESSTLEGKHPHEQRRMKWKRKYWLAGICNTLNSHHPVHQKEVKIFQKKKCKFMA